MCEGRAPTLRSMACEKGASYVEPHTCSDATGDQKNWCTGAVPKDVDVVVWYLVYYRLSVLSAQFFFSRMRSKAAARQ
jgi:hypothetical protein